MVTVGFLLFIQVDYANISTYQDYLLQFEWFLPTLYSLSGLLIIIGIVIFFNTFAPTHKKPGLYKTFEDGQIYISRRSVEKAAFDTLVKYSQIRQPNVVARLINKRKGSYIEIKADFFVPGNVQVQTLTEQIRNDIKESVEHFAEIPVKKLEVNVKDQKTSGPRVL